MKKRKISRKAAKSQRGRGSNQWTPASRDFAALSSGKWSDGCSIQIFLPRLSFRRKRTIFLEHSNRYSIIRGFPWLGAGQRRRLDSVVPSSLFASIRVHLRFLSFPHFGCGYATLGPFALIRGSLLLFGCGFAALGSFAANHKLRRRPNEYLN